MFFAGVVGQSSAESKILGLKGGEEMELTTDEKNLIVACLRDFINEQKSDFDRAESDQEWAQKWAWVLKIAKRNFDMAQELIKRFEK